VNAEQIGIVSAAVVMLTQLVKWMGLDDVHGPWAVLGISLLGVTVFAVSQPLLPSRFDLFAYFSAWVVVSATAAGVFGFTRAASIAITRTKAPPTGAGASPTVKVDEIAPHG
jgi:hypothetical protein